jgi:hypothetical protein
MSEIIKLFCDTCGKDFRTDKMYQRHMNKKTPCKKKIYKCIYCKQEYTQDKEYENHLYICEPRLMELRKCKEESEAMRHERMRKKELNKMEKEKGYFMNENDTDETNKKKSISGMLDINNIFNNEFFASVNNKGKTTNVVYMNGKKMDGETFNNNMSNLMKLCMDPEIKNKDGKELSDKINLYVNEMVRLSLSK